MRIQYLLYRPGYPAVRGQTLRCKKTCWRSEAVTKPRKKNVLMSMPRSATDRSHDENTGLDGHVQEVLLH